MFNWMKSDSLSLFIMVMQLEWTNSPLPATKIANTLGIEGEILSTFRGKEIGIEKICCSTLFCF